MSPSLTPVNLENIDGGGAVEQVNHVLKKIYENVQDRSTDPEAKRVLVLTIVIEPNETREDAALSYQVQAKLPGPKARSTAIFFAEEHGKPIALSRDLRQIDAFDPTLPPGVTPIHQISERAQAGGRS